MTIYIVRHGQVDSNLNKIYNIEDEDINENGIRQAEELKEKIKDIDFDIIFCSPLLRAKHTAEIINSKNKEIIIETRLKERSSGNLSGKPLDFIDRETYWDYYTDVRFGTEENIKSFFERVHSFLDELKDMKYNKVLLVAHSGVSKAVYAYFNGIPENGKLLELGLKNAEIKKYETRN